MTTSLGQSWDDFKDSVTAEFANANPVQTALLEIRSLKQTSSHAEYQAKFAALTAKAKLSATNHFKIIYEEFLRSLPFGLSEKICNQDITTTTQLYKAAAEIDGQWQLTKNSGLSFGAGSNNQGGRQGGRNWQRGKGGKELQQLTDDECNKLMKEGQCFHCHKTGHMASNCKGLTSVCAMQTSKGKDKEDNDDNDNDDGKTSIAAKIALMIGQLSTKD